MIARNFIITGRVQGVFFRRSTQDFARQIGCRGWIKNTSDGSVKIYFLGTEIQYRSFRTYLNNGPPLAQVDEVIEHPAEIIDDNNM